MEASPPEDDAALYVDNTRLWPNGHVPVCWVDDGFSVEKGWVKSAVMDSWARVANLSFTGWESCTPTFLAVRINIGDEMYARVLGRDLLGGNSVGLDFTDGMESKWSQCTNNDLARRECIKALSICEFGHVLGFAHEHNRPDTPDTCDRAPQGSDGNETIGPWDTESIMNYCADTANLSDGDVAGVVAKYGKPAFYNAVWRPGAVDEVRLFGADYATFSQRYAQLWDEGWRIALLNTSVRAGVTLRDVVWHRGNDAEYRLYGWGYDAFRAEYDRIWPNGWRMHILNTYVRGGSVRYDVVFRRTGDAERQLYAASEQTFRARNDEFARQNYRLHTLTTCFVDGAKRHTAVWKQTGAGEVQAFGWTYEQFRAEYDRLWGQGLRLHLLNSYVEDGVTRYNATWQRSNDGEIQAYGWRYGTMVTKDAEMRARGWHLQYMDIHEG